MKNYYCFIPNGKINDVLKSLDLKGFKWQGGDNLMSDMIDNSYDNIVLCLDVYSKLVTFNYQDHIEEEFRIYHKSTKITFEELLSLDVCKISNELPIINEVSGTYQKLSNLVEYPFGKLYKHITLN